jgi:peptidoglycan/xylan/chitin deacetylase (PgdA/CDA1 family)
MVLGNIFSETGVELYMKRWFRRAVESSLGLLPITRLLRFAGCDVLSVYYHRFDQRVPEYFRGGYSVKTATDFELELDALLQLLPPLSLSDLLQHAAGQPLPVPFGFFLSFDDGYRELYDVATPILKARNVPATVFITTSLLDNRQWLFEDEIGLLLNRLSKLPTAAAGECEQRFFRQFGQRPEQMRRLRQRPSEMLEWMWNFFDLSPQNELDRFQPYLTSAMVRSMLNQGISFGGHGQTHSLLASLSPADQRREIRESIKAITNLFGLPYRVFAFPYGDFDVPRQVLEETLDAGEADLLFGTRGVIRDEFHPRLIQRLWAENHMGSLVGHIRRSLSEAALRSFRGTNTVRRRM